MTDRLLFQQFFEYFLKFISQIYLAIRYRALTTEMSGASHSHHIAILFLDVDGREWWYQKWIFDMQ